jgi:type III secretion protein C
MNRFVPSLFRGAAAGLLALCALQAAAAKPAAAPDASQGRVLSLATSGRSWSSQRFVYRAEGKRVTEVLQDFAASQGLPAVIAEGIEGTVQASFDNRPEDFLNAMSKAYGILWYHDGAALYFYPAKAIQSRLFRIRGFSRAQVEELLNSLQIGDKRYPLRYNEAQNTLLAYGPPRHVDLIASALESLDAGAIEKNRLVVRVFPLRFATAADRSLGELTIPGLASTLRALYGGMPTGPRDPQQAAASSSQVLAGKLRSIYSMYGTDRLAPQVEGKAPDPAQRSGDRSTMGPTSRGLRSPVQDDEDVPAFEADDNTNAVIVHGRLRQMADVADLIHRLDLKPALIELEAMIIDVSSDAIDRLGINWSYSDAHGSVSVGSANTSIPGDSRSSSAPGTFSISTVWANAGRELLARIDALQGEGKARIIAKPKVLGVANRPALMQEKRVAAVRVSGNLEANLFQVEAGTLLQVTPQIVTYGPASRIKLSLYIEDGNFEGAQVDNVPIVKRTQIRTEAHVTEGESLLIGGITLDSEGTQVNGVPGISKLPVVGGLFRWEGKRTTHSERLFLITPRLVKDIERLPPAAGPAAAPAQPAPPAPVAAANRPLAGPQGDLR